MKKSKILLTVLSVLMTFVMLASVVGCSKTPKTDGPLQIIATNETYKELFDKFTADTGIKYEMLSMSSGAVLSKLQAEGDNPTFDVWFGGGINDFINAKDLGYLQKVDFKAIKDLNPLFVDSDHQYFSKGMTIVGFAVNNDVIKEKGLKTPKTWDDIIDASFDDEIVFSDPSVSGTCYAVLYALMQKKGEDYVKKFADNILYLGSRGKDPIEKTVAGECAVGITYVDGTLDGIIGDANVSIVYPTDGIPWTPEGVAAIKNSPNAKAGAYFVEWLYSDNANLQLLAKIDKKGAIKAIKPSLPDVELGYDADFLYDIDLTEYASKATEYKAFFAGLFK